MRKILVTGTAGFIGFHLAKELLAEGWRVHGFDGMTDYYDVRIKQRRHAMLAEHNAFSATEGRLEDAELLKQVCDEFQPDVIVHLAAQAGVRYSLENPRAYLESNMVGTFNVMECARELGVDHLLMASTSSVYGANEEMPFRETEKADTPLTFYAATKKATEAMAHSYAHLFDLPAHVINPPFGLRRAVFLRLIQPGLQLIPFALHPENVNKRSNKQKSHHIPDDQSHKTGQTEHRQ